MNARVNFGKFGESTVGDATDGHVLTIAPTGAGKGASSIIPNLLGWPGSALVLDPDGETARRTLEQRRRLGQSTFVLDPFGVSGAAGEGAEAGFNPLDFVDQGPAGVSSADRLADALILEDACGGRQLAAEARALLKALILFVRTAPQHEDHRDLAEVNRLASFPDQLTGTLEEPGELVGYQAYDGLIARAARRLAAKPAAEASRVWSSVQLNLARVLDPPQIARSLAASSFDFRQLRQGNTTLYAVLPAQHMRPYNRWLRLVVASAFDRLFEGVSEALKPPVPILAVLDEFQHLGDLEAARTAFSPARGAGLKLWLTVQSLSQLDESFGETGRENVIANCGSIEIFGVHDPHGCRYFARKTGELPEAAPAPGSPPAPAAPSAPEAPTPASRTHTETGSLLVRSPPMRPHEIAALGPGHKLLFRRNYGYLKLEKVLYFEHPRLRELAR